MKVITAKTAGFCFGVKRAVDTVYEEISRGGRIYTYGEIIHNEEVVRDLQEKGVTVLRSREELTALTEGTVIIRSHGVPREIYRLLREKSGIRLVDATCPFVSKIHRIVEEESAKGKQIVVIGDRNHPEVQGIIGFSDTPVTVIQTPEEAGAFQPERVSDTPGAEGQKEKEVCVVSQTTFHYNNYKKLVEILKKKCYAVHTVNTICSATEQRQKEAREIASQADLMIVIGGAHSSNTRKLFEICSEECRDTRHIQTPDDLNLDSPDSLQCIGITAGASTPNYIIEEVQSYVRGTDF